MRNILLIFASAAINGAITYLLLTNIKHVISFEDQPTPSDSAEDEETK